MARELPILFMPGKAGADLSAKRFCAVKLDANGDFVAAGAGEVAVGILQDKPESGQGATVMVLGIAPAIFGAAVLTPGTELTPDAAGKLVTAAGADARIAVSLVAVSKANVIAPVLLVSRTASGITGLSKALCTLSIPVKLSELDNAEVGTDLVPGITGKITKFFFVTGTPTTDTTGVTAVLTIEIGSTPLTGGVLTIDADTAAKDPDTLGKVIEATAITADNDVVAASTISIKAANVTPFTDGEGTLVVVFEQ